MIINSPTELVFRDLFYRLEDFADGHEVFLKLEGMHITGSIKFKTAMGLIEDLERRGVGNPAETTIVESSSGNLGIALSLVCAAKGYRFICVTDPKANLSNIKGMQLYGAEVIVVDKPDPVEGFLGTRLKTIQHLLKTEPNAIWLNQYANLAAKNVHAEQTAEEIIAEFEKVDWIFIGSGTTGTISGVAERLRQTFPHIKVIAVEPEGSVTFGGEPKKRSIPGIGTAVRPPLAEHIVPDEVIRISEPRTVDSCREFVRDYHLLVGGSTGAVLAAVRQKSSQFKPGETVVAISPDLGEKYLDTVYDPAWVAANINQIITNLEKGDVAWMATTGNERRVSKGEVLITAGEPVEALLIVLDGELSVMLDMDETVARLTAGDIVGEMSLIEDRPPTVSVMCATDARVLAIPFSEIRRRLDSDTAFASRFHRAFAVFLSHRLRATMARLNAPSGGQRSPLNAARDGMRQLLSHLDGGTVREKSSQFKPGETVVAMSPDLGEKYLDTIYDPGWVAANINQIITNLEKGDVAWMATTGNERRVSKGEVLITAGEPVEALLIVLDGELSVMLDTDETVARLTAGDIVGEMSLIEDRPPTVSVMCATDARVLAIPFSEIRRRLDSDTAFASRFHQAFAVFLSHRLRATMARLGYGGSEGDGQASVGAQNAPGGGQRSPLNAARDGMRQLLSHLAGGT